MAYKVTAALVIVPDETGAQRYFYEGAVLPSGLDSDRVKQLAKDKMLEKVEDADEGDVPAKSASKAKWVAYATSSDRGEQALSAEDAEALTRDELAEKFTPEA